MTKKKKKNPNTIKAQRQASSSGFHFLNLYQNCNRKFFIKYVTRMETKTTSPALIGGTAFHEGKAVYYQTKSAKRAITRCEKEIRERKTEYYKAEEYERDLLRYPILLNKWIEEYGERDLMNWELLYVEKELKVKVPNTKGFYMTLRPDLIIRDKADNRNYLIDTKTSSFSIKLTQDSLYYGDQATTYLWGASKATGLKFVGLIADIAYWNKQAIRMDNIKCIRGDIIRRTPAQLKQFEKGVAMLFNEVSQKLAAFVTGKYSEYQLFPRNTYYCMSYNRVCEYAEVCRQDVSLVGRVQPGFIRVPKSKSLNLASYTNDTATA